MIIAAVAFTIVLALSAVLYQALRRPAPPPTMTQAELDSMYTGIFSHETLPVDFDVVGDGKRRAEISVPIGMTARDHGLLYSRVPELDCHACKYPAKYHHSAKDSDWQDWPRASLRCRLTVEDIENAHKTKTSLLRRGIA